MKHIFFISLLLLILVSCSNKQNHIENQWLTIEKKSSYYDITDPEESDILHLVQFSDFENKETNGGLQSIFSIDHSQDQLFMSNAELIEDSTPEKVLKNRLRVIEESCAAHEIAWKNFTIVRPVTSTTFKGYPAAVAEFEVAEEVSFLKKSIQKRIKRYVVFVNNDLWNIVLAPTQKEVYKQEMKIFDEMIATMKIK